MWNSPAVNEETHTPPSKARKSATGLLIGCISMVLWWRNPIGFILLYFSLSFIEARSMCLQSNYKYKYYMFGLTVVYLIYSAYSGLRLLQFGQIYIFAAILSACLADLFGYLVGTWIKSLKLTTADQDKWYNRIILFLQHRPVQISPAKTCAGFLAAVLSAFPAYYIMQLIYVYYPFTYNLSIKYYLFLTIVAQVGDLLESALKRACSLKESGFLLGSHGGTFDRADSSIATLIAYCLFLKSLACF